MSRRVLRRGGTLMTYQSTLISLIHVLEQLVNRCIGDERLRSEGKTLRVEWAGLLRRRTRKNVSPRTSRKSKRKETYRAADKLDDLRLEPIPHSA